MNKTQAAQRRTARYERLRSVIARKTTEKVGEKPAPPEPEPTAWAECSGCGFHEDKCRC